MISRAGLTYLLECHSLGVYSWGPDGCVCGFDCPSDEHIEHVVSVLAPILGIV